MSRARVYLCFYCGRALSRQKKTRDHIQPRSRGGSNAPKNIVDACRACNGLKGSLSLDEFRLVIAFRAGLVKPAKMKFPGEIKRLRAAKAPTEDDFRILKD